MNITAATASAALPALCREVLDGGQLGSRNGAVREQLFAHVTLTEPWRREILTPGRKADIVAQIAETLWVLAGRNDVEWLSAYLPRAKDFSDDGTTWRAGYGPRIRGWGGWPHQDDAGKIGVDQLAAVVDKLRANPEDRRAVISLWDPAVDNVDGKDIACNNWLHFLVRDGRLHLHVAIRSNDLMWGWSGINAFEWSALQELVASMVGVEVGELHFAISSLHLYEPHWAKAERIAGALYDAWHEDSPRAQVKNIADLDSQVAEMFKIEGEMRQGRKANWSGLADEMLRSWMRVLAWHWTKNEVYLIPLQGTRLYAATRERPKLRVAVEFAEWAAKLHAEKHALYGDSWKKRGEQVSIQANIARKIDRLGKAGAGDTELDTTTDLLVYLVKYGLWLSDPEGVDDERHVDEVRNELLEQAARGNSKAGAPVLEEALQIGFEKLVAEESRSGRFNLVESLTGLAFSLALLRYTEQQKEAPIAEGAGHAERNATRRWNPEPKMGIQVADDPQVLG